MKQKTVSTSVNSHNVRNETYCFENMGLNLVSLDTLASSVALGFIVSHTVLKFNSAECHEYCVLAFILWFRSRFYFFTIQHSHLYQSVWDIQMLIHRYLRRSEWLSVLWEPSTSIPGRVYGILFTKRVILRGTTAVVD